MRGTSSMRACNSGGPIQDLSLGTPLSSAPPSSFTAAVLPMHMHLGIVASFSPSSISRSAFNPHPKRVVSARRMKRNAEQVGRVQAKNRPNAVQVDGPSPDFQHAKEGGIPGTLGCNDLASFWVLHSAKQKVIKSSIVPPQKRYLHVFQTASRQNSRQRKCL